MAAEQDVIRQFLVSLGFKVDETGLRKFTNALGTGTGGVTNVALTAGKAVAGIAIAAETMVTAFAFSMEKLYYASKRTNSSVENIQGLEYGFRRVGLGAGVAKEGLEAMAAAVRMNPGMRGLMDSLVGHSTAGMDQTKAMLELVQRLATMPHYVGARFAQMFGMDEKTFLMVVQGLPELNHAMQQRSDMNKQAGVDAQAAAEASKEYANSIREIGEKLDVLGQKFSIILLPYFRQFNSLVSDAIDGLLEFDATKIDMSSQSKEVNGLKESLRGLWATITKIDAEHKENIPDLFKFMSEGADGASKAILNLISGLTSLMSGNWSKAGSSLWDGVKGAVKNAPGTRLLMSGFDSINKWRDSYRDGGSRSDNPRLPPPKPDAPAGRSVSGKITNPAELFSNLEEHYGLPDGFLDKVWNKESRRGKNMRSPAGAKGHFQFMDDTAKIYGVKNPDDLTQSATGAAHYYSDLLKKYKGSLPMALAAYNWGPGNLDKKGFAAAPFETRNYVAELSGATNAKNNATSDKSVTIHQKTDIHVNGAANPSAIGAEVRREQDRVNGDLVRNFRPVVQ